jgi:hypothetical protein
LAQETDYGAFGEKISVSPILEIIEGGNVNLTIFQHIISMFLTSLAIFLLVSIITTLFVLCNTFVAQAAQE